MFRLLKKSELYLIVILKAVSLVDLISNVCKDYFMLLKSIGIIAIKNRKK